MRRLKTPTRRRTKRLYPLSSRMLTLLAAVSVTSAGGTATHRSKHNKNHTAEGQALTVTTPTPRGPWLLLLLLLMLRTDTPEDPGATPHTHAHDAVDPGGCQEAAQYGPSPPTIADKNEHRQGSVGGIRSTIVMYHPTKRGIK